MAFGGWFAGALYDHFGFYAPAFAAGATSARVDGAAGIATGSTQAGPAMPLAPALPRVREEPGRQAAVLTSLWITRRRFGGGSFENRAQLRPDSSPT